MIEKTLIEYVIDYLQEETDNHTLYKFNKVEIQGLVSQAIDAYEGGAR